MSKTPLRQQRPTIRAEFSLEVKTIYIPAARKLEADDILHFQVEYGAISLTSKDHAVGSLSQETENADSGMMIGVTLNEKIVFETSLRKNQDDVFEKSTATITILQRVKSGPRNEHNYKTIGYAPIQLHQVAEHDRPVTLQLRGEGLSLVVRIFADIEDFNMANPLNSMSSEKSRCLSLSLTHLDLTSLNHYYSDKGFACVSPPKSGRLVQSCKLLARHPYHDNSPRMGATGEAISSGRLVSARRESPPNEL